MHNLNEFLLAAAIGLVFHFGLHPEKEAYTVFGLGILLTLAVHLISRRIQETELKFRRIYGQSHRLDMLLHQTYDPETAAGNFVYAVPMALIPLMPGLKNVETGTAAYFGSSYRALLLPDSVTAFGISPFPASQPPGAQPFNDPSRCWRPSEAPGFSKNPSLFV